MPATKPSSRSWAARYDVGMCLDSIETPAQAAGVFVLCGFVLAAGWFVERELRRRARAKRDREWYKKPPKKDLR